jgi:hypothetical protein
MSAFRQISITTAAVFVVGAVGSFARDLPQYEFAGFPISPFQITVLGSGGVQERATAPTLTLNGMPASPHQIAVIGPRPAGSLKKLSKDASGVSSQTTN